MTPLLREGYGNSRIGRFHRQAGPPSGVVVGVNLNGLARNYNPPGGIDAADTIAFNPTAQIWQANHGYGTISSAAGSGIGYDANGFYATVIPSSPNTPNVRFSSNLGGGGVSGAVEPVGAQVDGTLEWALADAVYAAWAATTHFNAGDFIVASGAAIRCAIAGTTGAVQPVWNNFAFGDPVFDGSAAWLKYGPATAWAAATHYVYGVTPSRGANYPPFVTLPASPLKLLVSNGAVSPLPVSGAVEPAWGGVVFDSGLEYADGDIIWHEGSYATGGYAKSEKLVLTGLLAPAAPRTVTIRNGGTGIMTIILADQAAASFGSAAASAAGNGFSLGGVDVTLAAGAALALTYNGLAWAP